jgi:hypothetical protein
MQVRLDRDFLPSNALLHTLRDIDAVPSASTASNLRMRFGNSSSDNFLVIEIGRR